MNNQTTTALGGRNLEIVYVDGRKDTYFIKQFPVKEWKHLLPKINDEFALIAAAAGKPVGVIESLSPVSYHAAYAAVKEVNAEGFFVFADRMAANGARELALLPPDMLKDILLAKNPANPSAS